MILEYMIFGIRSMWVGTTEPVHSWVLLVDHRLGHLSLVEALIISSPLPNVDGVLIENWCPGCPQLFLWKCGPDADEVWKLFISGTATAKIFPRKDSIKPPPPRFLWSLQLAHISLVTGQSPPPSVVEGPSTDHPCAGPRGVDGAVALLVVIPHYSIKEKPLIIK